MDYYDIDLLIAQTQQTEVVFEEGFHVPEYLLSATICKAIKEEKLKQELIEETEFTLSEYSTPQNHVFLSGKVSLPFYQTEFFISQELCKLAHRFIVEKSFVHELNASPGRVQLEGCWWLFISEVIRSCSDLSDPNQYYSANQAGNSSLMYDTSFYSEPHTENVPSSRFDFSSRASHSRSSNLQSETPAKNIERSRKKYANATSYFTYILMKRLAFFLFRLNILEIDRFEEDWLLGMENEEKRIVRHGWRVFRYFL